MIVNSHWISISAAYDFSDKPSAKRSQVREDEVPVRIRWVLGETGMLAEVVDAHGREHRDQDVVVREIGVEWAAERKVLGIVREGAVDAAVAAGDVLVGQTGEELLEIAKSLRAAGWTAEAVVVCISSVQVSVGWLVV